MVSKRFVFWISILSVAVIGLIGIGPLKTRGVDAATAFTTNVQGSGNLAQNQNATFQISATDTGSSIQGAIVDVEIYNSNNQKVYQQFYAGQNFNGGQQITNSFSWTPSATGNYTVKAGVFSANWSNLLSWNDDAFPIVVSAAGSGSGSGSSSNGKFSATGSVIANSFTLGQQETLNANVVNAGSGVVSNAIVMIEVADASNNNVFQQLASGQNFAPGESRSYSAQWTPTVQGTYHLNVGVFTPDWSSLLGWVNGIGTMNIGVPGVTQTSQTITPAAQPLNAALAPVVTTQNTVNKTVNTVTNTVSGGVKFYVDPNSEAAQAAKADPSDAAKLNVIASHAGGVWFGDWNANVRSDVNTVVTAATAQGATPVLVAYNIPDRDCGGYSAGGAQTPDAYRAWIQSFANGIGSRKAIVILEPDGLANIGCMSSTDQATRLSLIASAVSVLKGLGNTQVYIDAGNPNWIPASTMAQRLASANVASSDGFALNTSNFYSTAQNEQYGDQVSSLTGGKHYVIDTSRNGNGAPAGGAWCNPSGRAIGAFPTANTGSSLVNYFLWAKPPGESDGSCNGGPAAGNFWTSYAVGLVNNAGL